MVTLHRSGNFEYHRVACIEYGDCKLPILAITLCIAVVCGMAVDSNTPNTPGRWTHPCGIPMQMTSNPNYQAEVSRNYVLNILIGLEEAIIRSVLLLSKLVTERLGDSEHLMTLLQNATHDSLPDVINWETSTDLRNMTSSFKDDYTLMSVLGAFLERSKLEEGKFQSGEYMTLYESLEERHFSTMCNLQSLIASLGGTIDVFIKREDVMPDDFHEESIFARSVRDYVTVKQTEDFYADLMSKYGSII